MSTTRVWDGDSRLPIKGRKVNFENTKSADQSEGQVKRLKEQTPHPSCGFSALRGSGSQEADFLRMGGPKHLGRLEEGASQARLATDEMKRE